MKMGVVGLPNVGKSTLFNAITQAGAQASNYPFTTIEPNVGIVPVPDKRLDALAEIYNPEKYTPTTLEFVDIAGLVRGASRGEGLGNQFLSHIRQVDAIVHVVRCFDDDDIIHVDGSVDPARDIETINLELLFADMDTVKRRADNARKRAKSGDPSLKAEEAAYDAIEAALESGISARNMELDELGQKLKAEMLLLTDKPVIYAANIAEDEIGSEDNDYVREVRRIAEAEGSGVITISAKIEAEISAMPPEEREVFLEELGIEVSGLDKLVASCYDLLGLMSYLTAGPKEVRAWTIPKGTRAPQAAGKIHSDFERGFIRAEIVNFDDLIAAGSMTVARERGQVRSEGKDYVMRDGDVVLFRFNV